MCLSHDVFLSLSFSLPFLLSKNKYIKSLQKKKKKQTVEIQGGACHVKIQMQREGEHMRNRGRDWSYDATSQAMPGPSRVGSSFRGSMALPTLWFWTVSLQNNEGILSLILSQFVVLCYSSLKTLIYPVGDAPGTEALGLWWWPPGQWSGDWAFLISLYWQS